MERQIVEHTSPAWRLLAVGLFFAALFFGGWFAKILRLEEQFSTFFVLVAFFTFTFWAKKRPDKLRRRFGAFGKIAAAIQESADDIRASVYSRTIAYGIGFGAGYAVLVIVSKEVVLAVVMSIYAWQIVAAVGCLVAAVTVAPQFFQSAAKRMSVSDEDYPENSREVEEVEGTEAIEERPQETTERVAGGIGYYDNEGNPITAKEFERLLSGSGDRDD